MADVTVRPYRPSRPRVTVAGGVSIERSSGAPASSVTIVRRSSGVLSAALVVRITDAGRVVAVDPFDLDLYGEAVGVSVTAAGADDIDVQVRVAGEVDFGYDAMPAGEAIYCGPGGVLTTTPPTSNCLLIPVGTSITARILMVQIGENLELA